jgi:spore coat polysaccharide biosynthesis protein SpsF|tara:strand:+ start:78 stop:818 length:741 start_codon:yes stop_codon:yes gene_type:complete
MITAIIQIRLNSSRLKRKALLKIQNLTLIEHLFSQLSYSTQIDKKIIATTTESIDNDIEKLANNIGIECFRGNSLNVLDRYYNCAKSFDIDTIVRISGDAPLIDPVIVDKTIEYYKKNNFDYVSNFFRRTFPIGTEIEIFSFKTLEKCWKTAQQSYEKEHVTPFIYEHPELFNIGFIEHSENLSNLHWTVDRIEDFNFVEIILQKIKERPVSMNQILNLLKLEPDLLKINGSIDPLESFKKSKMNQ